MPSFRLSKQPRHFALGQQSYDYDCLLANLGDAIVCKQFYRCYPLMDRVMMHFVTGPCKHPDDRTSHAE